MVDAREPGKDSADETWSADGETASMPEAPTAKRTPNERVAPVSGTARSFAPDEELGPYRLIHILGKGGFGEVWEVERLDDGRRLALKILTAGRAASETELRRFEREGRLAAAIHHPRVVFVFAAEVIDGHPTIAIELASGGTLMDRLRAGGPLPVAEAVDRTLEAIEGLEAARERGVLHRDVKPSNLFLDADGGVKVGDFGLSRTIETDVKLTATGTFIGTPAYSSPEQVRGRELDHRSDIYSLGATLFHMLTGHAPFEGDHAGDVLARILTEPPAPPRSRGSRIPAGLRRVVLRALAKDPRRRPQTYAELRRDLSPFRSTALTEAGLALRAGAIGVDLVLLELLQYPLAEASILFAAVYGWLTYFFYFLVSESVWGRSLGKWAVGLRVAGSDTAAPSPGKIVLRTAVFATAMHIADLVGAWFGWEVTPASPGSPFAMFLLYLGGIALIVSTMRRRNGYAGLHEIPSGTRVLGAAPLPALGLRIDERSPTDAPPLQGSLGPFVLKQALWTDGQESLLLAEDTALTRPVWIHRHSRPSRDTAGPAGIGMQRGAVRWLQGGRDDQGRWDAYEAPPGIALERWVHVNGPLAWRLALPIAASLLDALLAREGQLEDGVSFSVGRVWVTDRGTAMMLPFQAPGTGRDSEGVAQGTVEWPAFLRSVLLLALEGRIVASGAQAEGPPQVPLPEPARLLLSRLFKRDDEPASLARVRDEWRDLLTRPREVTRGRRLSALLLGAAFFLVLGFSAAAVPGALPPPSVFHSHRAASIWTRAEPDGWASEPARAAIGTLMARAHCELHATCPDSPRTPSTPELHFREQRLRDRETRSPEEAALLARAASDFGQPGGAEYAAALELARAHWPQHFPRSYQLRTLITAFFGLASALVALLGALVLRVGPAFRLTGIRIQTRRGRPASRLRCVARVLVAWSPFLLVPLAMRMKMPFAATDALVAAAFLGAVYALVRPAAGLQDLIAGTRLVPR